MLLRDGVSHNPKVLAAGPEAAWLWVASIDYSRLHLTDGFVPASALPTLATFRPSQLPRLVDRLLHVHLFIAADGGYRIHDFLEHNDSKADVMRRRAEDAERKRGQKRGGIHKDSARIPAGIQQDREALARARVRVGGGSGSGSGSSLSEGEPERESPTPFRVLDDYWQAWREAAAIAGTDIRLGASATEREHLRELAAAYTVEDFATGCQVFWASRHLPSRALGLLRSLMADLLAHAASGSRRAFRSPDARQHEATPAPTHTPWRCPHEEPRCTSRWRCEQRTALEAAKAEAS